MASHHFLPSVLKKNSKTFFSQQKVLFVPVCVVQLYMLTFVHNHPIFQLLCVAEAQGHTYVFWI